MTRSEEIRRAERLADAVESSPSKIVNRALRIGLPELEKALAPLITHART